MSRNLEGWTSQRPSLSLLPCWTARYISAMAPTLWTKEQKSALLMLAIKLEGVKKSELTTEEQAKECYICHEAPVSNPKKSKSKQIVRLRPCECVFHKECIVKHALIGMVVEDIQTDEVFDEDELAAISDRQQEEDLLHHDKAAAASTVEW